MELIYADAYWSISVQPFQRLVRLVRSASPFPTLVDAEASFAGLRSAFDARDLTHHALLVDSRDAPGRNDDAFEALIVRNRDSLFGRFERRAVVVRTMVGKLQSERMSRSSQLAPALVFTDEDAAVRALLAPASTRSASR